MNQTIRSIEERAASCDCGKHNAINMHCSVGKAAIRELPGYLNERGYSSVLIVADRNTWNAAGEQVKRELIEASVSCEVCILTPNEAGDVIADERTIVEIMLQVAGGTDAILAVGSGTIHDAVRFVCWKLGKAFVSVPTAASVDGYASAGAPLIVRGVKKTFQAISPEAIFADLDVLVQAPLRLTAAGFGDMLGKYTSLADWILSRDLGGEPFCPLAYDLTEQALEACISSAPDIAARRESGIRVLFEALTVSGFAMLLAGHSRSASGAEHHLSHFWEMEFLRSGRTQLLHGAKVGVATTLIAALYRALASERPELAGGAYGRLPSPETLKGLLKTVGGPCSTEELGLEPELVEESLDRAYHLRDRYTGLKWTHEHGRQELFRNL